MTPAGGSFSEDEEEFPDAGSQVPLTSSPQNESADDRGERWSVHLRVAKAWRILLGRDVSDVIHSDADVERGLRNRRAAQENKWRDVYAFLLLICMVGQVVFANYVIHQAATNRHFNLEPSVLIAFMSSVVVEVIGLVVVVTKSIFPSVSKEAND